MREHEEQLVAACLQKDQEAFKLLYDLYAKKVYNLAYRMLGSIEEAEDVTQEVFVTVYQHLADFKGWSKFSTWLYKIAFNASLKYRKRRPGWRIRSLHDTDVREEIEKEASRGLEAGMDKAWIREEVQKALDKLPIKYKSMLLLKEIEGLSYAEIAAVIGCSEGTVASRLNRARKLMEKQMRRRL